MAPAATSPAPPEATKRERLREIIARRSFRNDRTFTLASGRTSNIFFDLKPTMLDPDGIDLLADVLLDRVEPIDAASIGGLVMGAVPIVVAAVLKSRGRNRRLQGFWVRKEQKDHGAMTLIDGHLVDGSRVIVVEDVTTTGGSAMKAIDEVRRRGCEIAAVITIVDRLEGARENLAAAGIELIALFDRNDFVRTE
jgi:orotate phosphoribosyltransferase